MKNTNLLLVDDNHALRSMLGFSLELAGYPVFEAESRQEALDVLQSQNIHIVLLDMGMPPNQYTPEEGLAVLDWLNEYQPKVKVLVLTGQEEEGVSYLALKKGAFDFLKKPVSVDTLLAAIKRACLFSQQGEKLKEQEGIQTVQIEMSLGKGVKEIRNQAEQKLVKQVLADTEFNVHETARRLGLKRENVYYLIKKYGLQRAEPSSVIEKE